MKGIILAGGTGSRLLPLTRITNKHLLPVYDKPMIYYPINTLVTAGIKDILIVTGRHHAGAFMSLLGSGKDFGVNFTYKLQDESDGIAKALSLAEDFANGENIAVILGDNIFQDDFSSDFKLFDEKTRCNTLANAEVFLKKVKDPQRFGVPVFEDGKIFHIDEKPKEPKSEFAVTGLYLYDQSIFRLLKGLKPSARGEYEITDANNFYAENTYLSYNILNGEWSDAGTFESLYNASRIAKEKKDKN